MAMSLPATTASPRATGAELRSALLAASGWLDGQAERINALNVFPVPDGDTGTNMSLTLRAAADALRRAPDDLTAGEVARTTYEAAMLGARGNSGVILSQLLKGFAHALDGVADLGPHDLSRALAEASEVAYAAVSRPVEGTILSVARETARAAAAAADEGQDLPEVLRQTVQAARAAVDATPQQLDVLHKAGVVDSGGEGYRVILEGVWMWLTGQSFDDPPGAQGPHTRAIVDSIEEEGFGFCTEVMVRDCDLPLPSVKAALEELGDSVIVVGDNQLLRVHVHTPRPGRVLDLAVDHGTLARVKVENMQLQHQEFAAGAAHAESAASSIGVVAVVAGEGFKKVFRSLGAMVVDGGQTMNPSVQDLLAAVNSSGHRELVVLPNNSNIVLTARQAQALTPHTLEVVPTESSPQGIGALLAFNFQADLSTNVDAMRRAARAVRTVEVTRALRDAEIDGRTVRAGQWLGLFDGAVVAAEASAEAAAKLAVERGSLETLEVITVYYGVDANEPSARALADEVRAERPGLEVEVVPGGQPHYPYVISLE